MHELITPLAPLILRGERDYYSNCNYLNLHKLYSDNLSNSPYFKVTLLTILVPLFGKEGLGELAFVVY